MNRRILYSLALSVFLLSASYSLLVSRYTECQNNTWKAFFAPLTIDSKGTQEISIIAKPKPMRIMCIILTYKKRHKAAQAILDTWGKRCDKLLFFSDKPDPVLNIHIIKGPNLYKDLWIKTMKSLKVLYDTYLEDYDWFLKADDDTYVIMENLRYMVEPYPPHLPLLLGTTFIDLVTNNTMILGGAGYLLSQETLRRYGEKGFEKEICFPKNTPKGEDVELSLCLLNLDVVIADTRDSNGYHRMTQFTPGQFLTQDLPGWHYKKSKFPNSNRDDKLSDMAVSFHWLTTEQIYEMEYFFYKLNVIGLSKTKAPYPPSLGKDTNNLPKQILEDYNRRLKLLNSTKIEISTA